MFLLFSPCSTVAASINALATVTFEDFVKSCFPHLSDKMSTWISKGLCRYSRGAFYSMSWNVHVVRALQDSGPKCTLSVWGIVHKDSHFQTCQEGNRKELPAILLFTNLPFDTPLSLSHTLDLSLQHLLCLLLTIFSSLYMGRCSALCGSVNLSNKIRLFPFLFIIYNFYLLTYLHTYV